MPNQLRRTLSFVALLLFMQGAGFAGLPAFVRSDGNNECVSVTSCTAVFGSSVTAGNFVVLNNRISAQSRTVTVVDINDSACASGHAFTSAKVLNFSTAELDQFYLQNITAFGTTMTTCISGAASTIRLTAAEYSGILLSGSPLDATAVSATGSSTACASGNITTATVNTLAVGACGAAVAGAFTVGGGWSDLTVSSSGASTSMGQEDQAIAAVSTTVNAQFTIANGQWGALCVLYKSQPKGGNNLPVLGVAKL